MTEIVDEPNYREQALQWLSRTIAITAVMVAPGYCGRLLDQRLGTQHWTPAGFVLGIGLATGLMILLANKLVPPGRGEPISDEEWSDELAEEERSDDPPSK